MMTLVVFSTVKGAVGVVGLYEVAAKTKPWLARITADVDIYVKVGRQGAKETGSIVFSAVADNGDTVTVDDGIGTPVVFTFGDGTGGTVNKGVTAADSAQNLKTAINADATLNVTVTGASTTLTVTNDNYTGGALTKSDADNDYAVTDFSGGVAGAAATSADFIQWDSSEQEWAVPAGEIISVRGANTGSVWVSEVA